LSSFHELSVLVVKNGTMVHFWTAWEFSVRFAAAAAPQQAALGCLAMHSIVEMQVLLK
jgi:hypothetical protein